MHTLRNIIIIVLIGLAVIWAQIIVYLADIATRIIEHL